MSKDQALRVHVCHSCPEGSCTCSGTDCRVRRLRDQLSAVTYVVYTITWFPECSTKESSDLIFGADKILILWNAFATDFDASIAGPEVQTADRTDDGRSKIAQKFLFEAELAHYRQIDESRGDLVIHVELEDGAFPESRRRQASPVTFSGGGIEPLVAKLQAPEELRPCGNVAYGLAWTFSIGYLMRILPDFQKSVEKASETCENLCWQLLVIIPRSGFCPGQVLGCENSGLSVETIQSVGGVSGRSFKNTIYTVKDSDRSQEVYHAAIEYATPVRALYNMALTPPDMSGAKHWLQQELSMFGLLLTDLTRQLLGSTKSALRIVDFDDTKWQHLDMEEYLANQELQQSLRELLVDVIKSNPKDSQEVT